MADSNTVKPTIASESPYNALAVAFESYQDETLEIEVLNASDIIANGQAILQDGLCIGITKKNLAKAFLEARALFMARNSPAANKEAILGATKTVLLFDPEYLTAANYRKCHIQLLETNADLNDKLKQTVQRELRFLNSILTSPLHRQSKSPTLWYHRYWLVAHYILPADGKEIGANDGDRAAFLDTELQAVLKSAERHPHNYYAWLYLRRLLALLFTPLSGANRRSLLAKVQSTTLKWILQHPSDVSGWSFLSHALFALGDSASDSTARAVAEIEQFAKAVGWRGERLLIFLQEAAFIRRKAVAADPARLVHIKVRTGADKTVQ